MYRLGHWKTNYNSISHNGQAKLKNLYRTTDIIVIDNARKEREIGYHGINKNFIV